MPKYISKLTGGSISLQAPPKKRKAKKKSTAQKSKRGGVMKNVNSL